MPAILNESAEQLSKTRELLIPVVTPWLRAYGQCSAEVQAVVRDMLDILTSNDAEVDETEMATATLLEALFPTSHLGDPGADLEELSNESTGCSNSCASTAKELEGEEAVFADRVLSLMKSTGRTQEDLARAVGVGQPAISMMLARKARPQKRTVRRIAQALGVSPTELWPGIQEA